MTPLPPLSGARLVFATMALALATFMIVLDTTIANVSIPAIAGDLGVSPSEGTWVITSFAVSNAISVPLTGWLTQRIGQVRLFLGAVVLFVAVSLFCGLSESLPMLLAFRVMQGAVAGPMIPLSQALLLQSFPKHLAGMAIAMWSMTVAVAPVMGPILGGWLTDNASWPWIFYINIPVGLFAAYVTGWALQGRESPTRKLPIDVVGLALLVIWVGATQIMLDRGKELDWFQSNEIVVLALVAGVGFCFFLVWELTEAHPVVDLSLFRLRNFTTGTLAMMLGYAVFFGNVVLIPLWLQQYMGYTATWAGLVTSPVGILSLVISPWVGRNLSRFDPRLFITVAFAVFAFCSFWRSLFSTDIDAWTIILTHVVQGVAMATFFIPLTAVVLSGLDQPHVPPAAGLFNFCRIMGGGFAASVWTTLWENRASFHHARLTERVDAGSPALDRALHGLQSLGFAPDQAIGLVERELNRQAFMLSADDLFWLSGMMFAALAVLIWFARPTRHAAAPPAAAD
jgi:MFS transporter, DHA2 family, multidrug resistance protein